jgi:anti-anti-sigma regulatory factor
MASPLCTASRLVDDGVLVATVTIGEIREPDVAYDLRNELLNLVKSAKTEHLIIDARNMLSIGSVGFLAFLGVRRELKGRIVLCHLSPQLQESFAVCRLIPSGDRRDTPFEMADSLESAVGMFAAN